MTTEFSVRQDMVTFQAPADDHDEMKKAARKQGISKSLFIRQSIKFAIKHKWNKEEK